MSGHTVTSSSATASAAPDPVLTATARSVLRRRAGWLAVAAAVLVGVIVLVVVRGGGGAPDDPLSATNPAPDGSMAVVQVLEQHGVHVIPTDSLQATREALRDADRGDATVLTYDPQSLMSAAQRGAMLSLATDVVAVQPDLLALPDLAPGVRLAGQLDGTFSADCTVTAVQNAATVTGSGLGYRVTADTDTDTGEGRAVACLTGKSASGLVQLSLGSRTITVLGLGTALQNGTIASQGDAALALNLLGAHRTLIWYVSTYADLQTGATPSLAELTPPWVTPLLALLALAGVAAAIWRGRRFGPLVVENLPVVVRASETMEGRARLYSRAKARLRALDALRVGAVERLARSAGLPRTATVDEVVGAVSALTGRDRGDVAAVLLDEVPGSDADLVRLSDELLGLETAAGAARQNGATRQNGQHG